MPIFKIWCFHLQSLRVKSWNRDCIMCCVTWFFFSKSLQTFESLETSCCSLQSTVFSHSWVIFSTVSTKNVTLQTGQIFTLLHCRLNRGIQLSVDALVVSNLWHFSFACPLSCPPLINVLVTEKSNVVSDAVIPITCAFWKCSTTEYGHIFPRYAFCS